MSITLPNVTSADLTAFRKRGDIIFTFYQLNTKGNLSISPSTAGVMADATDATDVIRTIGQAPSIFASSVFSTYHAEADRPISSHANGYLRLTTTSANGGVVTANKYDVSDYTHAVIVTRSTTASTAAKLKIYSTLGTAEIACALTTSATANKWIGGYSEEETAHIFPLAGGAGTGVTITGTPDLTSVNIGVTIDDTAKTLDIQEIYFIRDSINAIGTTLAIPLPCAKNITLEDTYTFVDLMCNNVAVDSVNTGSMSSMDIESIEFDIDLEALATGTKVTYEMRARLNEQELLTVNTATHTVQFTGAGKLRVIKDKNGLVLRRARTSTSIAVGEYWVAGNIVTLNDDYVGEVFIQTVSVSPAPGFYTTALIDRVAYGELMVQETTQSGIVKNKRMVKATLQPVSSTVAQDGNSRTYKLKAYADGQLRVAEFSLT